MKFFGSVTSFAAMFLAVSTMLLPVSAAAITASLPFDAAKIAASVAGKLPENVMVAPDEKALKIEVKPGAGGGDYEFKQTFSNRKLTAVRGHKITFSIEVKGREFRTVDRKSRQECGVVEFESGHKAKVVAARIPTGSFGWKRVSVQVHVPNDGKLTATLGVRGATGTLWFRNPKVAGEPNGLPRRAPRH